MRKYGLILTVAAGSFILVAVGEGQQPGQFGGGRFGGGGGTDAASLIRNQAVIKELKISDEQSKKIAEAMAKAIGEVLNPDQMKRLKEIEWQQRGAQALGDAKVQESLKFTDAQKSNINSIMDEYRKDMAELRKEMQNGNFEAGKKMGTLRKEMIEKTEAVLTDTQKKAWKDLQGEEFKMPTFGGFGGSDGKKRFDFKKKSEGDRKKSQEI